MVNMEKYGESDYVTTELLTKLSSRNAFITSVEEVDSKYGKRLRLTVELVGGKLKYYSPSRENVNILIQAFGSESTTLLGKQLFFMTNKDKIIVNPVVEKVEHV
jgi:hypothetical protein